MSAFALSSETVAALPVATAYEAVSTKVPERVMPENSGGEPLSLDFEESEFEAATVAVGVDVESVSEESEFSRLAVGLEV